MKVVIIGGVAGGASAAARLRRLDEAAEIVMLERSGYISYANCGLPYYVGGVIQSRDSLTLQTPESFGRRFRVDVRVRHEAVAIDRVARQVQVRDLAHGTSYAEPYDKLILAPGAKPLVPPLSGLDTEGLFTLRTVEDALRMDDFIRQRAPRSAVVIGAGFIGLEMAENLRHRGLEVTVVQLLAQVMPTLDADMAAILHGHMRWQGVRLLLEASATGFAPRNGQIVTAIRGRGEVVSDMVVLAVGVAPDGALAREAGLEMGLRGAIRTDVHMRTSDENIYAVGDAVEVTHLLTGQKALVSLAGPANKQGRIAADNLCGIPSEFRAAQGSSILKLFDMTVASTGLSEQQASEAGLDSDAVILAPPSHATYYPGAESMTLKVRFEKPTGRILGAQIVGFGGVDKRLDVLATAIRAGMTASDLEALELAYAPPYGSAKDPVNMAGFAMGNVLSGLVKQVHWPQALADGACLLDTRTDAEFSRGHIPGALHIPLDHLRGRLEELPRRGALYVYCQSGLRSYLACRILAQHGFDCYNVAGGYGFYAHTALDAQLRRKGVGPCGLA